MKLKKLLTLLLSLIMLCGIVPLGTFAASAATSGTTGDCIWELDGLVLTISGNGAMGDYDYYNNQAPWGTDIIKVIIKEGVTTIGMEAFYDCSSLVSITIPNSVISIGTSSFWNCDSITTITIPDGVTTIGNYSFRDCSSLISITIPDSVISIGDWVFCDCVSLTSIKISDSVKSVGDWVFCDCDSLTSIKIPDSVISIGDRAFYSCDLLTSITISDSVTTIGRDAFSYCSSLTSITIPNSVTSIGVYAFSYCSSLTSITIPDSVTTIGGYAFYGCRLLERVDITDLDAWLKIEFGDITSNPLCYGANLYLNNQLVTEIKIPDGTQIINEYQCYNMKDVENIFIPKSLILVKQNAFNGCESIKNVYYEGTAEEWNNVTILAGNDHLKNATVYYNSTGIPGGIISVAVTKSPDKLQYIENTENLDLMGGVLTVYYDGGATRDIDLATLKVDGFDNSVFGKQTLTVRYGEFLAEFEIEIISRPISFVAISTLPTKREYVLGEKLDLTGGKIAVGYPEGNYEIFDLHDAVISAYDTNKTGYQIITVTYKGNITEFTVAFFKNGDLDGDENINATDVAMLRINLLVNSDHNTRCDINKDGTTDIRDLVNLKKKTVEMIA